MVFKAREVGEVPLGPLAFEQAISKSNQNTTPEVFRIHLHHCFTLRLSNKYSYNTNAFKICILLDIFTSSVTIIGTPSLQVLIGFSVSSLVSVSSDSRQRQLMLHRSLRP